MWILYTIKKAKTGELRDQVVSRLRPSQTYVISRRGKVDNTFEAAIETDPFLISDVTDPKFRPEIRLVQIKSKKAQALVDEKIVGDVITLHDESNIRITASDSRFRVRWKDMAVYKDGPKNDEYRSMIKKASELGFHVTREWSQLITHVWISDTPQTEVSHALIKALMNQKFIITKSWLEDVFLKSEDRKFDSNRCFETIKPIEWPTFGPLKKPAILGIDKRRLSLFKDINFITFDKDQNETLSALIKSGKGNIEYYDLNNEYDINISSNTVFISPPEERIHNKEKWEGLKNQLHQRAESIREIQEVEVGYAIMYCSTEHMCNSAASLSSFNLHSAESKSTCDRDQSAPSTNVDVKIEDESNHHISNSMASTIPYNYESFDDEHCNSNQLRPSCSLRQEDYHTAADNYNTKSSGSPMIKPMSPTDAMSFEEHMSLAENTSAIGSMSPIEAMSPLDALSPIDDSGDVDNFPSMPSLNNLFDDFSVKMKPLPPPRKPNASPPSEAPTSSTSAEINNADRVLEHTDSPVPSTSNVTNEDFKRTRTPPPPSSHNFTTDTETHSIPHRSRESTPHTSPTMSESRTRFTPPTVPEPPTSSTSSALPNNTHNSRNTSTSFEPRSSSSTSTPQTSNNDSMFRAESSTSTNSNFKRVLPFSDSVASKKRKTSDSFNNLEEEDTQPNEENIHPTNEENHQETKKYTEVIYKPLVVNPSPPPRPRQSSNGVNYKKFKKVRQFEDFNYLDVINMVSSTQRVREARQEEFRNRTQRVPGVTRLDETADFDPSLMISVPRRPAW